MKIIVVSSLYESIDENRRMRLGPIHILRQVGLENASFADVQYCIYADIVGGPEKVQNYADVATSGSGYLFDQRMFTF